jgi:preprotein translocase subunit SecD
MNPWTTTKGLIVAFMLACAAGPAIAASDEAQQVDKMRAKVADFAEKAIETQGGSRILFKVDADALREAMLTELRDDVYRIVREGRIPFSGLAQRDGGVEVRIAEARDRERLAAKLMPPTEAPRGAALAVTDGGDGLIRITPTDAAFAERLRELVRDSMAMIEQLLRDAGVGPAGLQPDGDDRIRAVLPGVTDPGPAIATLTRKRQVTFRLVDESMTAELALRDSAPPGSEVLYGFKDKTPYLLLKEAALGGDDIANVAPGFDSATRQPIASFRFNARGARRFAHVTADNVGKPFAIVLDDSVISVSVIREPITGGSGQIAGNFTLEEANTMAMQLRSGTPAGRLGVVDQQVVEPAGK